MKGKELIELLKGKEDWEFGLNIRHNGKTIGSDEKIYLDEIEEYKKGFLTVNAQVLNSSAIDEYINSRK